MDIFNIIIATIANKYSVASSYILIDISSTQRSVAVGLVVRASVVCLINQRAKMSLTRYLLFLYFIIGSGKNLCFG